MSYLIFKAKPSDSANAWPNRNLNRSLVIKRLSSTQLIIKETARELRKLIKCESHLLLKKNCWLHIIIIRQSWKIKKIFSQLWIIQLLNKAHSSTVIVFFQEFFRVNDDQNFYRFTVFIFKLIQNRVLAFIVLCYTEWKFRSVRQLKI